MLLSTRIKIALALWFACEAIVFVLVAETIGTLAALLLMVVTSLFGWTLLKRAGASAMVKLRAMVEGRLAEGRSQRFLDETLATFGALALLMPGFLSDLVGLALAVPAARDRLAEWIGRRRAEAPRTSWRPGGNPRSGPSTIDLQPGEWERDDPARHPVGKA